jgi:hypothetical protein
MQPNYYFSTFLKDVQLQPNEATNVGCTPIWLLYNYCTANIFILDVKR